MHPEKCTTCKQIKLEGTVSFHKRLGKRGRLLPFICKTCQLQLKRGLNPEVTESRLRRIIEKRRITLRTPAHRSTKPSVKHSLPTDIVSIPYLQRKLKMTREGAIEYLKNH